MICLMVKMTIKPEKVEGFLESILQLVPEVRKEPGNRAYIPHRVPGAPNVFYMYEQYDDEAALQAHREHIARRGFDMQRFQELLAEPIERQVLELMA